MRKIRRLPLEELAPFVLELPEAAPSHRIEPSQNEHAPQTIRWSELFHNNHPVEIEVGFGKGLFLVNQGLSRPDCNFLGIEIVRKYQLYTATRVALRKIQNVKTCCADAKRAFELFIAPGSVSTVHVFFPDPWWKNRHKKRILMTEEFTRSIGRALKPDGVLNFVTDVSDYFDMVLGTISRITEFRKRMVQEEHMPQHDMDYLTNFERKFRKQGKPIYRAQFEKHEGTGPANNPPVPSVQS